MMNADAAASADEFNGLMTANAWALDQGKVQGHFDIICYDSAGIELWRDGFDNLVVTVGKNALEQIGLGASGTAGNAFMGLISSTSFSTLVAADTMSSHAGWLEAGNAHNPQYSGTRPIMAFGTASGGVISSSGNAFAFTNSGTVQGGFVVFSTGATGTIDNTSGVLFGEGTLSAAQPVVATNTLEMSYTLTLT